MISFQIKVVPVAERRPQPATCRGHHNPHGRRVHRGQMFLAILHWVRCNLPYAVWVLFFCSCAWMHMRRSYASLRGTPEALCALWTIPENASAVFYRHAAAEVYTHAIHIRSQSNATEILLDAAKKLRIEHANGSGHLLCQQHFKARIKSILK